MCQHINVCVDLLDEFRINVKSFHLVTVEPRDIEAVDIDEKKDYEFALRLIGEEKQNEQV